MVLRVRDGEEDVSVRERGLGSVAGRECGNGLVVDHGGGWTTQYCHMARGSLVVRQGERVAAGQRLGLVGLSGKTEYPHLHFTVRRGETVVDPFALDAAPGTCGSGGQATAWTATVAAAMPYASGAVLNAGFAAGPVTMSDIEGGTAGTPPRGPDAPALVAFFRAISLREGDVQRIVITGRTVASSSMAPREPLPRHQAQFMAFAGVRRPPAGFAPGESTGLSTK